MLLNDYLDVLETAKFLKVHPETVRRLIRQGDLPAYKIGNKWFVRQDELAQFASRYVSKRGLQDKLL